MVPTQECFSPKPDQPGSHTKQRTPVWKPSIAADEIPMNIYRDHINKKFHLRLKDSHELHKWSVTDPHNFWIDLWDYVGLVPKLPPEITKAYDARIPISNVPPFFEGASINYAENVLTQPLISSQSPSLIGLREGQNLDPEIWTWSKLREEVRKVRSALLRSGIKKGDRVAALVSTSIWSVALFLGSASMGAIFTSIAPDLGFEVGLHTCIARNVVNTFLGMHLSASTSTTINIVRRQSLHLQGSPAFQCRQDFEYHKITQSKPRAVCHLHRAYRVFSSVVRFPRQINTDR